jgi:hypothetical protein
MTSPRPLRFLFLVPLTLAFLSCGGSNSKDPLKDLESIVQLYLTNTPTSIPTTLEGTSGTGWSNRPVTFFFQNYKETITRFEMIRVINGVSTSCDMNDTAGTPMVNRNLMDWAAASTQYTLNITATADNKTYTKTFGPIDITVQSAERVVTGGATLSTSDSITSGGAFFQTRTYDIGSGGYTGPNFNSTLAAQQPRLLDFAGIPSGGAMRLVSPSLINPTASTFDRMKNDCGFQTTTFAAYTGALDPETAPLTLAEVAALADPPAAATTIAPVVDLKFVYRTSDGKKGLVKVKTVTATSVGFAFSSAQ